MIPRFCAWTGWSRARIAPPRIAQSEALRIHDRESTAKLRSQSFAIQIASLRIASLRIASLRIAQSEALRIDGRESTAKLRPQSLSLRNPGGGATRRGEPAIQRRRALLCAIRVVGRNPRGAIRGNPAIQSCAHKKRGQAEARPLGGGGGHAEICSAPASPSADGLEFNLQRHLDHPGIGQRSVAAGISDRPEGRR